MTSPLRKYANAPSIAAALITGRSFSLPLLIFVLNASMCRVPNAETSSQPVPPSVIAQTAVAYAVSVMPSSPKLYPNWLTPNSAAGSSNATDPITVRRIHATGPPTVAINANIPANTATEGPIADISPVLNPVSSFSSESPISFPSFHARRRKRVACSSTAKTTGTVESHNHGLLAMSIYAGAIGAISCHTIACTPCIRLTYIITGDGRRSGIQSLDILTLPR